MDNKGMKWDTEHGPCLLTDESIKWIMKNVVTSKYNTERCYVYNKAFARWFDNNNAYSGLANLHMKEKYPRTGGIMMDHAKNIKVRQNGIDIEKTHFDLIREWASKRDLYKHGDPKTQALKLVEEVGETCRAILKEDTAELVDGIGDAVVVLTNLAELNGVSIEDCIQEAYNVIAKRTGKMINGTFVKDQPLTSYGRNKN